MNFSFFCYITGVVNSVSVEFVDNRVTRRGARFRLCNLIVISDGIPTGVRYAHFAKCLSSVGMSVLETQTHWCVCGGGATTPPSLLGMDRKMA